MRKKKKPRPPVGGRGGKESFFYESSENFSGVRAKTLVRRQCGHCEPIVRSHFSRAFSAAWAGVGVTTTISSASSTPESDHSQITV